MIGDAIRGVTDALALLRPVFDASGGTDGFVSVEVAPELAHQTDATIAAARGLHQRIDEPPALGLDLHQEPGLPDTLYVDDLIGPDSVNTLPEATIAAYEDHGLLARTVDADVEEAEETMRSLAAVGIDMDDVGSTLEEQGVASFHDSFQEVLKALDARVPRSAAR